MKIQQIFFGNSLRNFSYLLKFPDGYTICIDPYSATPVMSALKGEKLDLILNTHDHCDHYSGNTELVQTFTLPVGAHENAVVPSKTKNFKNEEIIYEEGEWKLVALDTPGHTLSHLCFLLKKNNKEYALFTGDCFFNAGVGNCHNGGNIEKLYETISEIYSQFSDDLLIYPGHEYLKNNLLFTLSVEPDNQDVIKYLEQIQNLDLNKTFFINSMQKEREINSFLRLKSLTLRQTLKLNLCDDKDIFIKLREMRNQW